ncbi:hypothetical protein RchiOBHm_Chr2g0124201 [Rosa chinensis]|uniref:FRIGIDA-like protein n=1 Tax=Rosa chinensis TaxID=74649 RepID=A0A2P6RT80_ROSCH|nr:hypothetical protein RchiOBHm_Chr2g0124201 [Rosa chinensis]
MKFFWNHLENQYKKTESIWIWSKCWQPSVKSSWIHSKHWCNIVKTICFHFKNQYKSVKKSWIHYPMDFKGEKGNLKSRPKIELELKQRQFDSQRKAKHLEPTSAAKNASVVSSTRDQSWNNMDGRSLQLVMNEQVEKIDLTGSRMSAVLQASSDPTKLVLDSMQGFYPSNLTVENREFESHYPQVREEAVKLAVTADNSWDLGGFGLFASYHYV